MTTEAEVCVVGGGPAGATVAARLAQLGHDVVVVEQHPFPRPHVGESLSPAAWPVLDLLGVGDSVASAGFTRTATARVRWRGEHAELVEVPGGLTVDRGRLDAILLRHARDCGARVLEPGQARRPARRDGHWELAVDGGIVRAGYLVDASGRRRVLGGGRATTGPRTLELHAGATTGPRTLALHAGATTGPRTLALHATWRGGPAPDGTQTRIEAIAEGWLWGAWLPGGAFRAMAFVDPPTLLGEGRDKARLYHRLLASSELFAELVSWRCAGRAGARVRCHDVRGRECDRRDEPARRRGGVRDRPAVLVGRSDGDPDGLGRGCGGAHDPRARRRPVRGDGVLRGHGAPRGRAPRGDGGVPVRRAPAPRERTVLAAPQRGRRASHAQTAPAPTAVADLLALPARLPDDATLRPTPVLVGDRVEWRRALDHPALDRPVAFLGGDEIAPLIDVLHRSPTLAEAIRRWDEILPGDRATAIAGWLHARGLLVADRVAAPA